MSQQVGECLQSPGGSRRINTGALQLMARPLVPSTSLALLTVLVRPITEPKQLLPHLSHSVVALSWSFYFILCLLCIFSVTAKANCWHCKSDLSSYSNSSQQPVLNLESNAHTRLYLDLGPSRALGPLQCDLFSQGPGSFVAAPVPWWVLLCDLVGQPFWFTTWL